VKCKDSTSVYYVVCFRAKSKPQAFYSSVSDEEQRKTRKVINIVGFVLVFWVLVLYYWKFIMFRILLKDDERVSNLEETRHRWHLSFTVSDVFRKVSMG